MPILRPGISMLILMFMLGCTTTDPYTGETRVDQQATTGAAALAGLAILGAAAYAASSDEEADRHRYHRHHDGYRRLERRNSYRPVGGRDVLCYPEKRACYRNGHFSAKWTRREF